MLENLSKKVKLIPRNGLKGKNIENVEKKMTIKDTGVFIFGVKMGIMGKKAPDLLK